jgi:hypothetical protein
MSLSLQTSVMSVKKHLEIHLPFDSIAEQDHNHKEIRLMLVFELILVILIAKPS